MCSHVKCSVVFCSLQVCSVLFCSVVFSCLHMCSVLLCSVWFWCVLMCSHFHRTPGRGAAGGWGLTPPGQTEPSVPYPVTSRWVPVGRAGRREGTRGLGGRSAGPVSAEQLSGLYGSLLCFLLICIVVVPVFPLFAVLLNCPYPDPPVSATFFSFSSTRRWREGRPRGAFVASSSWNQNTKTANLFKLQSRVNQVVSLRSKKWYTSLCSRVYQGAFWVWSRVNKKIRKAVGTFTFAL